MATEVPLGEPIKGLSPIGQSAIARGGSAVPTELINQVSNLIGFVTILGGLFFVIYMLVAGFEWLQAGGDSGKVEKAKSRMTNAAIGLLVMILSIAIVGIIGGVFGLDILNPVDRFMDIIPG